MKKTKQRKDPRQKKGKRPNPALPENWLTRLASDLMVTAQLVSWTRDEKLLLAAMLPSIRQIIKTVKPEQLAKLVGGPEVNIKVTGKVLQA